MELLHRASTHAESRNDEQIGTEHVLLAAIDSGNGLLTHLRVSPDKARSALEMAIQTDMDAYFDLLRC